MYALSASELLAVWEQGQGQSPVQQALTLLAAACPDTPPDALASMSIGRRDAGLLALRERIFGPRLVSLAICPACGERLELSFDIADIRADEAAPGEPLALAVGGYEVSFRLPNSRDLLAVADHGGAEAARAALLERCVLEARDAAGSAEILPPEVAAAISARMAEADPQADVQLALVCPACERPWHAPFDIASFFWSEINAWAIRTLRDVHALASAYGWREADILAMSPWRRQCYLEMVRG